MCVPNDSGEWMARNKGDSCSRVSSIQKRRDTFIVVEAFFIEVKTPDMNIAARAKVYNRGNLIMCVIQNHFGVQEDFKRPIGSPEQCCRSYRSTEAY